MMPGIDGYETARVIRAVRDEWIPIIFLSGRTDSSDVEAGIEAGGDDYLTKPVDLRLLGAKIRSMTRIARMRRQLFALSIFPMVSRRLYSRYLASRSLPV
jgi:DNA-binding response OmpR family regulator